MDLSKNRMGKTIQGGRRPGSGRPRKGTGLRQPVSFSLDPEAARKARELRDAGFHLAGHIEAFINEKYAWYFNKPLGDVE